MFHGGRTWILRPISRAELARNLLVVRGQKYFKSCAYDHYLHPGHQFGRERILFSDVDDVQYFFKVTAHHSLPVDYLTLHVSETILETQKCCQPQPPYDHAGFLRMVHCLVVERLIMASARCAEGRHLKCMLAEQNGQTYRDYLSRMITT